MNFIGLGIESSFPWMHTVLKRLAIPAMQEMIGGSARIIEVYYTRYCNSEMGINGICSTAGKAFNEYIERNGRQSQEKARREYLLRDPRLSQPY